MTLGLLLRGQGCLLLLLLLRLRLQRPSLQQQLQQQQQQQRGDVHQRQNVDLVRGSAAAAAVNGHHS